MKLDLGVAAGLCQAAVKAARRKSKLVRKKVLYTLPLYVDALSTDLGEGAMTLLVAGGIVELAVRHLVEAGSSEDGCLLGLMQHLTANPQGRDRLSSKGVGDQLMQWVAKRLVQVRVATIDDPKPLVCMEACRGAHTKTQDGVV